MKKVLLSMMCAMLMVSCSSKRAAMVDPAIEEAKLLQALARANSVEVPAGDFLISTADKQNADGQTEDAFISADKAILQFQISLLERENRNMADSLKVITESLNIYRSALEERRKASR